MDNPEAVPNEKVLKFEKLIHAYMDDSNCTIPELIRFCAKIMAKQESGRYRPKRNKTINKTPKLDK
jgi:hypothetical protein